MSLWWESDGLSSGSARKARLMVGNLITWSNLNAFWIALNVWSLDRLDDTKMIKNGWSLFGKWCAPKPDEHVVRKVEGMASVGGLLVAVKFGLSIGWLQSSICLSYIWHEMGWLYDSYFCNAGKSAIQHPVGSRAHGPATAKGKSWHNRKLKKMRSRTIQELRIAPSSSETGQLLPAFSWDTSASGPWPILFTHVKHVRLHGKPPESAESLSFKKDFSTHSGNYKYMYIYVYTLLYIHLQPFHKFSGL